MKYVKMLRHEESALVRTLFSNETIRVERKPPCEHTSIRLPCGSCLQTIHAGRRLVLRWRRVYLTTAYSSRRLAASKSARTAADEKIHYCTPRYVTVGRGLGSLRVGAPQESYVRPIEQVEQAPGFARSPSRV